MKISISPFSYFSVTNLITLTLSLALSVAGTSCQSKSPSPPATNGGNGNGDQGRTPGGTGGYGGTDFGLAPTFEGLLLTTVDASYQSSRLYFIDLADFKVEELDGAGSGDPLVAYSGQQGILFNRSQENFNYQLFDRNLELGTQVSFDGAIGDPHAALQISDTQWLLGLYNEGAIGVFDTATGKFIRKFSNQEFGLPASISLKPENFVLTVIDNRLIAVFANQVYFWGPQGTEVEARPGLLGLDLMESEVKVFDFNQATRSNKKADQSRMLATYGPEPVVTINPINGELVTVSLCFENETLAKREDCGLVVGRHMPGAKQDGARNVMEQPSIPGKGKLYFNGKPTLGNDGLVFISVTRVVDAKTRSNEIIQIDVSTEPATVTTVFEYPAASFGYDGIFYDQPARRLLIGDRAANGDGMIHVVDLIRQVTIETVTNLSGFPYSGTFIY